MLKELHLKNSIGRCVVNHTQGKYVLIFINSEQKPESFVGGKYKVYESQQNLA